MNNNLNVSDMRDADLSLKGLIHKMALAAALALPGLCVAEVLPHEAVITEDGTIETPLTNEVGDVYRGLEVFIDTRLGNCVACHVNFDVQAMQFLGDIGPELNWVGDSYTTGELRAILVDAASIFGEQTIMPSFYTVGSRNRVSSDFQDKTILTAQQVEDVVAYLASLANARAFEGAD